jgi:trigger factor
VTTAVETLEPTKVKLTVEVSAEELAPALTAAYRDIAQQVSVPGFRKGKVPARIIDQRIGFDAVLDYAVRESLGRWYGQAVDAEHLHPLDQPVVDVTSQPDAENRDAPLTFTAEVEIRPHLDLPELTSLTVTVPTLEVTDADIDLGLDSLRERFATLRGVDRPAADGDFVSIDLKATIGDKQIDAVSGVSYQIGSGGMLDGLDEALDGLSEGETTTFNAPLVGGDHEGEDGLIEVTVLSVKERDLPDLDDEFAEMASEFDTVEELREDMRGRLVQIKKYQQLGRANDALIEALAEAVEVPIPAGVLATMVDHETAHLAADAEEQRTEITEALTTRIRHDLLLDTLAETLNIQVTQGDLVNYLVEAASRSGMDPSQFVEEAHATGRISGYIAQIARGKAVETALRQAIVVDEAGEPVEMPAEPEEPYDPDADIEFDDEDLEFDDDDIDYDEDDE